jgi:hypothetical protein
MARRLIFFHRFERRKTHVRTARRHGQVARSETFMKPLTGLSASTDQQCVPLRSDLQCSTVVDLIKMVRAIKQHWQIDPPFARGGH